MADKTGEQDIRGIDIQKLAVQYAEEENVFKNHVTLTSTNAREIRWYKKTSGILGGTTTTGMTGDLMDNTDQLAQPTIVEQSWTRQTSYVREYFVESEVISEEDIKDSDPDVIATHVRDLVKAIARRVDKRIWDVATENRTGGSMNINQVHCSGGHWLAGTLSDPVKDIGYAKQLIRDESYIPEGGVLLIRADSHRALVEWLITYKGSSVPQFASEKIRSGVVMNFMGLNVVVSQNVTAKYGLVGDLKTAVKWKSFFPLKMVKIVKPLIGTSIRVKEEGEAILEHPKALCLLSGCGVAAI